MVISASKVECNSDILQEILARLPPKSVFKCRSVSKRWKQLVSDPYFLKTYSSQQKRSRKGKGGCYYGGFLGFIQTTIWFSSGCKRSPWEPTHRFLSVNNDNATGLQNRSICFPEKLGYYISSSNGLILCGRHPRTYHVVNPITKRWISLPPPKNNYGAAAAGLSCEEESSDLMVRYKVVRAFLSHNVSGGWGRTLVIETYSSETGEWKESTLTAPHKFALVPSESPLVIRGVFYWVTALSGIAVYDSNKRKREIDGERENHLELIALPTFNVGETEGRLGTSFWGSDDGHLWMSGSTPTILKIWMLPRDEYGYKSAKDWLLLHVVNSDTLSKYYPPIIEQREKIMRRGPLSLEVRHSNRCVVLEGFVSWDPIVVLLRRGKRVCLYNLESKSMKAVWLLGRPLAHYEYWKPYFEPVTLSSYTLGLNMK